MRVLLTNTARSWSGETAYVEMMAQGLASRGCQVHLASRAESQLGQRVRRAGLDVTELDMRRTPIALFRDIVMLRRLAIDFDPDVVHCNASLDTWLCASVFWLLRHRALRLRTKHNFSLQPKPSATALSLPWPTDTGSGPPKLECFNAPTLT